MSGREGTRSLRALLAEWAAAVAGTSDPQPPPYSGQDVRLTGLVEHTDDVGPGKGFVARVRTGTDGHPYIGAAIERGATLILGQRDPVAIEADLSGVAYLQVADSAVAEAWLSAAWHQFPSRQLLMIGVTGTDGKSTTVNLIHHILRAAGLRAGMLSTIKASFGDDEEPLALHVTTPEAPVVQNYLARMVDAGLTHCVLETTSHGLAQHRVAAIDFDLAVITNITHEHLDYHGDYEAYFAAKALLFEGLTSEDWTPASSNPYKNALTKTAVLNRDDPSYERLAALPAARQLSYSIENPADVSASDIHFTASTSRVTLHLPSSPALSVSPTLLGRFNVYNMLAASSAAHALGIAPAAMREGLEAVVGLPGRMERVSRGQEFLVIVDFAHTPNALANAIEAARAITTGRIITVFGSAGKRDVTKRRLMTEISARRADLTVLTAEDPRTESLEEILETMAAGCRSQGGVEGQTYWRLPDRGRAIHFALGLAQPEDLVLICGKGHEQSMCFGTIEYPWDDVRATEAALEALLSGRTMPDLGLPTFGGPTNFDGQPSRDGPPAFGA